MEIDGESVEHSANGTGGVRHAVAPSAVAPSAVTREGTLGGHLARRLVQIGVRDIFTVPGDFNLTLLDHLIAEPGLNNVGCCNELNAGYAADRYARANGVGACVVTFTVGGLSIINAIAGAYSENLPVICIVGGPNSNDDGTDRILHHTIGLPDFTQELKCFQTVTCYQAVVNNLDDAHELIDSAISTAVKESKPVYISISCNLPSISHPFFTIEPLPFHLSPRLSNQMGLECAVEATAEFLNEAVKPVLVGGPKMRVAKRHALSSNQLAAKVLRRKMEGKHQEAENIFKRMDVLEKNSKKAVLQQIDGNTSRCIEKQLLSEILTQKERCHFCFENAYRPKHLVISIGNATYLMLPTWEPVVQGHCCILPLQHESATRTIDKNVWEELRNFKKCLLKMFSREGKDVIFLETVTGLSRQRRHCLIECIPIPSYKAKQAPLYFKKAIDDAEGEWGQHDMKKVIPTSGNLRNVIPENFSYFHVEFGLDNGFVHVIDDDTNFPSSFGSNVIRGMLCLPEETMHRHQRRQPSEKQKQAIADFVREWKPFDWTNALE